MGAAVGITGVPTLFINGVRAVGGSRTEYIALAVELELARAR
jgi:hypothetical protein